MSGKFKNSYTAADIRKTREQMKKYPDSMSQNALTKVMMGFGGYAPRTLKRMIAMAQSFSDEVIDLFEAGKINGNRLSRIAETEYPNPSYREFLAKKAVEEDLTYKELDEIRDLIKKGRHPVEAIDVLRGRRPKDPITKNDALSLDRLVKDWERDGFSWRQRAELIKAQGKIQILQNGVLNSRIGYTLAAMKVAIEDMHLYVNDLWKEIPKEAEDAIKAEFRDLRMPPREAGKEDFSDDVEGGEGTPKEAQALPLESPAPEPVPPTDVPPSDMKEIVQ